MRVLVTGGAGFIGSHVVEAYLAAGYEVAVLDDLSTGAVGNVPDSVPFFRADVRDIKAVRAALEEFRPLVVNHHAAKVDVATCEEDPETVAAVNVFGTANVLNAAAAAGVLGFIFASSGGAIYGECSERAQEEDPLDPVGVYGQTKVEGEELLARAEGMAVAILRYANVYGPRARAGVIPAFVFASHEQKRPTIYGDGEQQRDFIHVRDVARANLLALEALRPGTRIVCNVASGEAVTVNWLLAHIVAEYRPRRPGEIGCSLLAIGQARRLLGFDATVSLEEGLAESREVDEEERQRVG